MLREEVSEMAGGQEDTGMTEETKQRSLEENFARLEELIGELERDDIALEEAFTAYSAGMKVLKQCNDQIDKVEKQVLKLTQEGELEEFGNGSISI